MADEFFSSVYRSNFFVRLVDNTENFTRSLFNFVAVLKSLRHPASDNIDRVNRNQFEDTPQNNVREVCTEGK